MEPAAFPTVLKCHTKVGYFQAVKIFSTMQDLDTRFQESKPVQFVCSNVQEQTATPSSNSHLILLLQGLFEKPDPKHVTLEKNKIHNITKA